MQAILAPLDHAPEPIAIPPHLVQPFPFNVELFNATFGRRKPQPLVVIDAPDSQQYKVAEALRDMRRAGAEQIADATGLTAYTVRKRLTELEHAHRTEEKRRTRSGRPETVWEWRP